jgi:hypothetical protein
LWQQYSCFPSNQHQATGRLKVAHLEIATNVTQEWDVADSGNYEEKKRTSKDQHGEQSG